MSNFDVQFSSRANRDASRIFDWLQSRSKQGAVRWLDALDKMKTRLRDVPLDCPVAEETESFDEPVRQILFHTRRGNTYRALFVVRESIVTILYVRGSGQAPVPPGTI